MSKLKKEKIKYNKNRAVLSDVLPYELPIIFSNRHFYKFISKHNIRTELLSSRQAKKGRFQLQFHSLNNTQKEIFRLLFNHLEIEGDNKGNCDKKLITIPFNFKILHKEDDFRELSIIHPTNQLQLVWFYNEFSDLIKYYSNISEYSIRKPYMIAKYKIRKDSLFQQNKAVNEDDDIIEESSSEYESLKTFFTYKKHSNIHKFFESYQYQRAEKKFNYMFKFDISKCFDSLYTHSITWGIYNKRIVKDALHETNNTFASTFDEFMQRGNYNETNGIVIGPEFSRIFAEIILQRIDNNVYKKLKHEDIYHRREYEVFRYVDDIFVFYNENKIKDKTFNYYKHFMKEYKLYINDSKSFLYEKPIITELTIAKEKVSILLEDALSLKIEEKNEESRIRAYIDSQKLITKYKIIIKESNVEYKDILNWTFAIVNRKLKESIFKFISFSEKEFYEEKFTRYLLELLDFSFFIYSAYPRTNTTIKISSIISNIISLVKNNNLVNFEHKHVLFKKIFDESIFILDKYCTKEHTQIETSYLLISLSEMGKYYRLNNSQIVNYFNLQKKDTTLNYWSIVLLLYYVKNISRYKNIKRYLKIFILRAINEKKGNLAKDTESTLLLFDILTCPFLEKNFKKRILKEYGVENNNLQDSIIEEEKFWFIKWDNFNFKDELESKSSLEVYS